MTEDRPDFHARLDRIEQARRTRASGGHVLRSDGPRVPPNGRMRVRLPVRGLVLALVIAVLVKAYLVWVLGPDRYNLEMARLLDGTRAQQAAAHILMPDRLTLRTVTLYDWIAEQVAALWP
ncbi:hypothetical protein [Roseicyclus marinus]|uniref:hypothetical protein n=1 Tax=Roseicyclus marinus TaxID=2161673 RepID=UPI00240EE1FA|nr:hypothetical protein [Roseicyclus marinus]MDG3042017.1 hypothetical protein [Roseicyclus marinus]